MGILTLDISAKDNQPPDSSGWLTVFINYNTTHTFTLANFTTETTPVFSDPEGDNLESIKITSLPVQGVLQIDSVDILLNDVITSAQLVGGNFTYVSDSLDVDGYTDGFMEFLVSDDGSSTFTTSPNVVTFKVAYDPTTVNEAPTTVGDGEEDITVGQTVVFTRIMLTSELNPPYADPEGDAALNLLVESVPLYGDLFLSGVLVVVNQVISFADIDLGNFTYVNTSIETGDNVEGFDFQISDVGSGQYQG